jgi:TRAP-type transport system small permease protein
MAAHLKAIADSAMQPTGLGKVINLLSKIITRPAVTVAYLSGFMCPAMMFVTFFDVGGRYTLNKPVTGSLEITEFMMAIMVGCGLAYCALHKGHIRVDALFPYLSRKAILWMDILAYGASCLFFAAVTWQSWLDAVAQVQSKVTSSVLFLPVYPFVFVMAFGVALLTLVFLRDFLQSIEEVRRP